MFGPISKQAGTDTDTQQNRNCTNTFQTSILPIWQQSSGIFQKIEIKTMKQAHNFALNVGDFLLFTPDAT